MTSLQYIEEVLRNNWSSSISGRPHDVGDIVGEGGDDTIKIVYESDDEWRRMDLANWDYIVLRDGGLVESSPQSFGWTQEDIVSRIDIDIRTTGHPADNRPGRIALYGERGAGTLNANESPRWGGIAGEAHRIVKSVRRGEKEYSIVGTDAVDDLSAQMGGQVWRALVQARLEIRSRTIDTSP